MLQGKICFNKPNTFWGRGRKIWENCVRTLIDSQLKEQVMIMGLFSNFILFLKALLTAIWRKIKEQRKTSNIDCEIHNTEKTFSEYKCPYLMQLHVRQIICSHFQWLVQLIFFLLFRPNFHCLPEISKEFMYVWQVERSYQ